MTTFATLRNLAKVVGAMVAGLCLPLPGFASDDTIVKIAQTGRIVLGAHDHSVPLSYLDSTGVHIGYHMEVCRRVVKVIQQRFDLPTLQVVTVPTTLATRVALLNNQTIDIECAHNPIKPATLSQALLSHATMVSEVGFLTTVDQKDFSFDRLDGRVIGLAAGGSAVGALRTLAKRKGFKITESFGKMADDLFGQLEQGRVQAVAFPIPLMMARRALAADPSRYVIVDGLLLSEPTALMFRLGDERLHALANEVLAGMMKSGEMARLYEKWYLRPIPGLAAPVGVPLPAALKSYFDEPGSEMQRM